uniref:Uncharacterized protein n=1 Tax=Arundo donax TaxID=35708 RepID=A0A0A8YQB6_ARUDO
MHTNVMPFPACTLIVEDIHVWPSFLAMITARGRDLAAVPRTRQICGRLGGWWSDGREW